MVMAARRQRPFIAMLGAIALVLGLGACQSDEEKLTSFVQRGDAYREAGQHEEAIIEYRNALQVDPNYGPAHEGLASSYLKTDRFKEGYWELSETIRLDPDNIDARLTYTTLAIAARQDDEALEQAQALVELAPDNPAAHLLLGQAYANLERWDEAGPSLERAVELNPDDGSYRLVLATYYLTRERPDEAEVQLRAGVERDPSTLGWMTLARFLGEQGRDEEALAAHERSIEVAQAEAEAAAAEGEEEPVVLAQAYQNLAAFHFTNGRADEAVAALEAGIERCDKRSELVSLLVRYYRSEGDEAAAAAVLEKAVALDPTDPEPFLSLSTQRGQEGDLAGALAAAEQALAADPTHVEARLRKAEVLIDLGARAEDPEQIAEGRAIAEEILAEEPTSPVGLFVMAKAEIATGNLQAGIDTIRAAIDARPSWPQAHFVLGSALLLNGEPRRARAELSRAVELGPGLIDARRLLVQVHADLGEHEYAIDNARAVLRERPGDVRVRIIMAQSLVRIGKQKEALAILREIREDRRTVDVLFALGRLQVAMGQNEEGRAALLQANELRPNNPNILGALLELDYREGKLSHSIRRVNDAVEANPDDARLWLLKGQISMATSDGVAAEKAFKKAIELDSSLLEAYQRLAEVYARTGRVDETVALYEEAVATQPENAGAHHFLGVLYEMTGRPTEAKEQYETALRYDRSLAETKNNLAYLLAESGEDLDRALKLAQEAKAAMPDSANAADTLGWVLYKRGVASAAVGYLREALQVVDPDDPAVGEISRHLSLAYEASGDVDKAIATLETALTDLERLKAEGKLRKDPPWAEAARSDIERLKSAG